MKAGKSATKPTEQQPIREEARDWITGNYYIKIGLPRSQVKALTQLGKRFFRGSSPCAQAARFLITIGMLDPKEAELRFATVLSQMQAGEFHSLGNFWESMMHTKPSSLS